MTRLVFRSEDGRFGLDVAEKQVAEMLGLCQRSSPRETGGILLGHYSEAHDCALVTSVTGAPADSRSGRTWFDRGVQGLQDKIDRLWRHRKYYYLGEWHFHPFAAPRLSPTDLQQVQEIAESEQYHCPEPVLLIIGNDPPRKWLASAYVFRRNSDYFEMKIVCQ